MTHVAAAIHALGLEVNFDMITGITESYDLDYLDYLDRLLLYNKQKN